jgi:hypothetical protein|tara:strand:+ start:1689 stop:2078 length:390 start_codon:yes stop_codon:yes gene_type:complete
MDKKDWKKEVARDVISLGSVVFFLLVVVRIWLLDDAVYLGQILASGIIFLVLFYFFRMSLYSGLALIVLVFTGMYYSDIRYWVFGGIVYVALLYSLVYLGKDNRNVLRGILLGILGSWVGNMFSGMIFG